VRKRAQRSAIGSGIRLVGATALLVASVAVACDGQRSGLTLRSTGSAAGAPVRVTLGIDTVARGLDVPWAIAFAPDGRIFVTERVGRIRVIERGVLRAEPWATLPVSAQGEAGLMGVALAPDFATTGELYAVGTFAREGALVNRVIRLTDDNGRGVRPTVVLDDIPAAVFHAGDAVAFGPDGFLYIATGDAREPNHARDDGSLAGKILRLRRDGSPAPPNPQPGSLVYARGVRNPQGLTWDPASGQAFATDHGPSGFPNEYFRRDRDELNVVSPDANLGWPTLSGAATDSRFTPPLVEWSSPGIAPSGAAFYTGPAPEWRSSIFVASLKGEQLRRVVVAPDSTSPANWRAMSDEALFVGRFGRLRAVAMGADGFLYFTTSNRDGRGIPRPGDDLLLRIRPQ
jgi:glucose/arabinose dehydrogenase